MTTTKKKAKRTLAQRVKALECDAAELRGAGINLEKQVDMSLIVAQDFKRRLTALEQAQRPAEKPAPEKRAGPWIVDGDQRRRMLFTDGPTHWVARVLFVNSSGLWHASTENRGGVGTQSSVTGAMHVCDEALRADGWTLDVPPAPAPSEDARLRDAVVDAALAWGGPGWLGPSRMIDATAALRAHRAKKGGA